MNVALTVTAALAVVVQGQSSCGREFRKMNADIERSIREFKSQPQNREEAAKKVLPLLKRGMNAQEVTDMLGAPGGVVWQYTLFYSSFMSVRFSGDFKVIDVISDLAGEVDPTEASGRDRKEPEVAAASSRFKTQPYSRQEPAKRLIPLIKPGMSIENIEDLLGPPDAKHWDYPLMLAGTPSLKVGFDTANNVTDATIVAQ
jgi:hypothetical protein